jgi:hypothetical protein
MQFNVTYERWTQDDLEHGETFDRGYLAESVGLREALEYIRDEPSSRCSLDCVAPSASWPEGTRCINWYYGADYETGESLVLALHFPPTITTASKARLIRLLAN